MLAPRVHHNLLIAVGLCSATLLLTSARPARAAMGIAFELPEAESAPLDVGANADTTPPVGQTYSPLPIPPGATQPPTQGITAWRSNPRAYQTKAAANAGPVAQLPPPPSVTAAPATPQPKNSDPALVPAQVASTAPSADRSPSGDIALGFPQATVSPPTTARPVAAANTGDAADPAPNSSASTNGTDWIFDGGSNSLVARIVGSAEGTRTPEGGRTRHYNGHRDPGNGVWNLGTFSYQHGASSPEEADAKQLARLARQEQTIDRKADRLGLQLTLFERLNALDLANQSPAAALNQGGYIDRLYQAQPAGKTGHEAIVWARTYAYMNPKTQRWNAPGLGNTYQSIRRDQNRRLQAIASALETYQMQQALAARPDAAPIASPQTALRALPAEASDHPAEPLETGAIAAAPASFTAPGNANGNPLDFGLAEASQTETTASATAAPAAPEIQLSSLQNSVQAPISSPQADRIFNGAESAEANNAEANSAEAEAE